MSEANEKLEDKIEAVETKNYKEMNLFEKLAEIRTLISVKKGGAYIDKQGKKRYDFYQIEFIYNQAKKLFHEYGIFTFFNMKFSIEKKMYESCLTVINVHNPKEQFDQFLDIGKTEVTGGSEGQMTGATQTYSTKYLYLALLMLDNGEDEDKKEIAIKEKAKGVSRQQLKQKLVDLFRKGIISKEKVNDILSDFGVNHTDRLEDHQLDDFYNRITGG